eukprot:4323113-Lingulodinium_polyedra.AAC.1
MARAPKGMSSASKSTPCVMNQRDIPAPPRVQLSIRVACCTANGQKHTGSPAASRDARARERTS